MEMVVHRLRSCYHTCADLGIDAPHKNLTSETVIQKIIPKFVAYICNQMARVTRQIVRIALLMMLFQFSAPAFLLISSQRASVSNDTTISEQHSSLIIPTILKGNDEEEGVEKSTDSDLTMVMDLSNHVTNLTAAHDLRLSELYAQHGIDHPPVFEFFCRLLI